MTDAAAIFEEYIAKYLWNTDQNIDQAFDSHVRGYNRKKFGQKWNRMIM